MPETNVNKWTFTDDMWVRYGTTAEYATLPTPDSKDEFFGGHPLAFYDMNEGELYLYDYTTKTWIIQ